MLETPRNDQTCTRYIQDCKKNIPTCNSNAVSSGTVVLPASSSVRPSSKPVSIQRSDAVVPMISAIPLPATCSMDISPSYSDILVFMDESMDTAKKRPSSDFMAKVQKDINPSMCAILIDWLVEVAEEYKLVPDTLHLTINYIDRHLSGNLVDRQRLQLLGVAWMMIASNMRRSVHLKSKSSAT